MKTNSIPQINCPKCNGTGKVRLGAELLKALQAVRQLKKATAKEVSAVVDPKRQYANMTAFNNQLNTLVGLGLVKRNKQVRQWIYEPAR